MKIPFKESADGEQSPAPLIAALVLVALVPAVGVLWFMSVAMRNERLAVPALGSASLIQRTAKMEERLLFFTRRHPRDDVAGEAAHDVGPISRQLQAMDYVANDGRERIAVVETERRQAVAAAAEFHGLIEPHRLTMPAGPKLLRSVMSVGSRLVLRLFCLAQQRVLRRHEFPSVVCQPCAGQRHESPWFGLPGGLDLLQFLHPGALQETFARPGIHWLRGEAVLNRPRVGQHPLEDRVVQEFRINRRIHRRNPSRRRRVRNYAFLSRRHSPAQPGAARMIQGWWATMAHEFAKRTLPLENVNLGQNGETAVTCVR
ncbi:MAG: hypothetical protein HZA93_02990 [Verrucomicrobia bacterium]|nr:hypothetical protein [Verrucomicrobiota bacterium]